MGGAPCGGRPCVRRREVINLAKDLGKYLLTGRGLASLTIAQARDHLLGRRLCHLDCFCFLLPLVVVTICGSPTTRKFAR